MGLIPITRRWLRRFGADESGAAAIEYALIASLVAVALVTALTTLGGGIGATFDSVSDKLPDAPEG